jgi:hypothetical protein
MKAGLFTAKETVRRPWPQSDARGGPGAAERRAESPAQSVTVSASVGVRTRRPLTSWSVVRIAHWPGGIA